MKILEPGTDKRGWCKNLRCTGAGNGGGGCQALLQVEAADLFFTYQHVKNETDVFLTFICAGCGVLTDLAERDKKNDAILGIGAKIILDKDAWLMRGVPNE